MFGGLCELLVVAGFSCWLSKWISRYSFEKRNLICQMAFILTMPSILVAVVLDCRGGFYLDVSTTLVAPFSSEVLSVILFCMYVEFVQEVHLIVIVLTLA